MELNEEFAGSNNAQITRKSFKMGLKSRFYLALFVAVLTISIHWFADRLYLYWTLPSVDIPIHFLGGLMSALFVLCFLRFVKARESLLNTFLLVLVIGLVWEGVEVFFRVAEFTVDYWINSVRDLVSDVVGGIAGYYIWKMIPDAIIAVRKDNETD